MGIERYQIINDEGYHRDTEYYSVVGAQQEQFLWPVYRSIDGVSVVLCKLRTDDNWWIVCSLYTDEERFTDIGPYVELEDALMHYFLLTNPEEE